MVTCPECGQTAGDDTRFCERCGQGLKDARPQERAASTQRPEPLPAGAILPGGIEIVELLAETSDENRYRAWRERDAGREPVQLRERFADPPAQSETAAVPEAVAAEPPQDPNGPHAKTAELRPPAAAAPITAEPSSGGTQTSSSATTELDPRLAAPSAACAAESVNGDARAIETEDGGATAPPADQRAEQDLGELYGRVLALSKILNHPAFERALGGFARDGRVYLIYPDEHLVPLSHRPGGVRMGEAQALAIAVQVCQAVGFLHRQALRLNDLCPDSVAVADDGRVKLTGLDYVSNDTELQSAPIFNDGYTAPEIYRGRKIDKSADVFSAGALLYTCLTGERLEAESWREEAGPIAFYPPHVVAPMVEQAVRRALQFEPARRWPSIDAFKTELIALSGVLAIRSSAITDVGMVRDHNEDSVMALEYQRDSLLEPARSFLYVVADGMGGAEAGEVASAIAVGTIRNYVESRLNDKSAEPAQLLQAALEEANRAIVEYAAAHPESRGMGSTGVAALILPPNAAVAWVGDSRAYLVEDGAMRQVTRDHSLVQRLIEIGQITAEQARHHEHKNVITRSLGARSSGPAGAEATAMRLRRGARLLLCSDGLTTHVDDAAIEEVVRRQDDPYDAARELVAAANAGGGTDNVSVICIFAV